MALYAIGDVQGCDRELEHLLEALAFSADRDHLWFVGDLVNRGPDSLGVLRRVRALGSAATVVLGNHDLHLLGVALGRARCRSGDTLGEILAADDRRELLDWLISRPLMHVDPERRLAMLHAGLPPQWDFATAQMCARELERALRFEPERLFAGMYGDQPDTWDPELEGDDRLRYIANCFTRLRYVDAQGRLALRAKGSPKKHASAALAPWFAADGIRWRGQRIVFGHWSTLGYFQNADVIGLDTGCVWGDRLTALRLDVPGAVPVSVGCAGNRQPGEDG
jgi:bis(5'-nucleosyl)-tetraphosphatase (symmetrical)